MELKWIKLVTDIFTDNRKIKQIELMAKGDTIIVIWFKLLTLAGRINDGGAIYVTKKIPYKLRGLAEELKRPVSIVKTALDTFAEYDMIRIDEDGMIHLVSWDKYQNTGLDERSKDQTRQRVSEYRKRKKQEACNVTCNVTCNAPVTQCNAVEEEGEKETEYHSITLSRAREENDDFSESENTPVENSEKERVKRTFLGGTLGDGKVLLSREQLDDLLEKLSVDEFDKYVGIIRDCEKSGKHYRNKTHYQAILDMAEKDRRIKQ